MHRIFIFDCIKLYYSVSNMYEIYIFGYDFWLRIPLFEPENFQMQSNLRRYVCTNTHLRNHTHIFTWAYICVGMCMCVYAFIYKFVIHPLYLTSGVIFLRLPLFNVSYDKNESQTYILILGDNCTMETFRGAAPVWL